MKTLNNFEVLKGGLLQLEGISYIIYCLTGKHLGERTTWNKKHQKHHKCQVCDKTFKHKQTLRNHLLMHNGEKHHKCDLCGKCFRIKADLKKHLLIHTGEKPHKCTLCDAAFTEKCVINTHQRKTT